MILFETVDNQGLIQSVTTAGREAPMKARRISLFLVGMGLVIASFVNMPEIANAQGGVIQNSGFGSPYTQSAKLTVEGGRSNDYFGARVAMDGNVIVVGAPGADVEGVVDAGAAYVYIRQAGGWFNMVQTAVLTASDKHSGDGFGWSVALDGDTIVVGAPTADPGGRSNAGAAYYFTKPASGWAGNLTETGKLSASDSEVEDDFGFSVAIDGGTIAVGALDVDVGAEAWAGVVYLYLNSGSGWQGASEDARLYASDGLSGDWFGYSVDIDGDVIAVGSKYSDPGGLYAAGSAYVFVKPASGWVTMTETAKLLDSHPAVSDRFGGRIGISGDMIVIGADGDNPGGNTDAGAAFVFEKPAGGWGGHLFETARLTSSDKESNAWGGFGISVAIHEDTIVVGSVMQDSEGVTDAGVAYIFTRPIGGWQDMTETYSITALDKQAHDEFGTSADISESGIVIGAYYEDPGGVVDAGSAYVFNNNGLYYQSFTSIAAQDGWILESRETSGVGGSLNSSQAIFMLGDSRLNQQYRTILSFNTSSLPENASIVSAVLRIKRWSLLSGNPFWTHKPLIADIRRPFFGSFVGLAPSDFQARASLNRAGTFNPASNWGWCVAILGSGSFPFINLAGTTQFRLRFALDDDNDAQADFVTFFSGNASPSFRPVLIVKYTIP
jgi:FG-GAP repeat